MLWSKIMLRKWIVLMLMLVVLGLSGCATDYSSSDSYGDGPSYPFSQRDWCNMGAKYCGPGP
jgi:hypothetical protein